MDTLVAATSLSGNYSAGWAVAGGLAGGIAFLLVVHMGLAVGMTRMNFLHILGTMMTPGVSTTAAYAIGFMMHMMASAVFGLAHAAILSGIDPPSVGAAAGWGLLIGAAHGAVILMVLPMMLSMMHPLVKDGRIPRPGSLMTGFGAMTPAGSLMAHVVFGVAAGAIYAAGTL